MDKFKQDMYWLVCNPQATNDKTEDALSILHAITDADVSVIAFIARLARAQEGYTHAPAQEYN